MCKEMPSHRNKCVPGRDRLAGPRLHINLEGRQWATHCSNTSQSLTRKWPRGWSWHQTRTRKKFGQPTLPASPAAPQPVGQTLRWVIGTREATGELRLQGDCAPVSRNLFKWTGQAGPPGAGVTEAAAPSLARPRTTGEPSSTA